MFLLKSDLEKVLVEASLAGDLHLVFEVEKLLGDLNRKQAYSSFRPGPGQDVRFWVGRPEDLPSRKAKSERERPKLLMVGEEPQSP